MFGFTGRAIAWVNNNTSSFTNTFENMMNVYKKVNSIIIVDMTWCNQVVLIKMRVILIRLSNTPTETMQTCHFQNYIRYGQVIYIAFRSILADYRNIPMRFLSGFLLKQLNILLYQMIWKWREGRGNLIVSFAVKHTAKESVLKFFWGKKPTFPFLSQRKIFKLADCLQENYLKFCSLRKNSNKITSIYKLNYGISYGPGLLLWSKCSCWTNMTIPLNWSHQTIHTSTFSDCVKRLTKSWTINEFFLDQQEHRVSIYVNHYFHFIFFVMFNTVWYKILLNLFNPYLK